MHEHLQDFPVPLDSFLAFRTAHFEDCKHFMQGPMSSPSAKRSKKDVDAYPSSPPHYIATSPGLPKSISMRQSWNLSKRGGHSRHSKADDDSSIATRSHYSHGGSQRSFKGSKLKGSPRSYDGDPSWYDPHKDTKSTKSTALESDLQREQQTMRTNRRLDYYMYDKSAKQRSNIGSDKLKWDGDPSNL